ncbi:hypothetical protein J437_LFUL005054 [Ladona fulva]|uniref:UBZ1-type domain-containing protein n=1 Tax=Ladona fulva TaxID=123851 RepID=A0A8K0KPR7_LADFU|nr:hypothetical protein J437_LFUL005054 [Ladona fulva]
MNASEDEIVIRKTHRLNEVVEVSGSHFALQVALQTMKERCQRLQQRLSFLEEENSRLKLSKSNGENNLESDGAIVSGSMKAQMEQMKEQLSQLKRQKSQLSHQIVMVVTENKQLWNRLSHMTKLNQSLGGHLTKISDTLNQHSSGSLGNSPKKVTSKGIDSKHIPSKTDTSNPSLSSKSKEGGKIGLKVNSGNDPPLKKDASDSSLEEISLKLLNSIQLEKTELENQYAQMVELNNDTSPSFNLNTMGLSFLYEDESQAVRQIKDHCKELEKMKLSLLEQQVALKNAVAKFKSLKDANFKHCLRCSGKLGTAKSKTEDDMTEMFRDKIPEKDKEEQKLEESWSEDIVIEKSENQTSQKELKSIVSPPTPQDLMHICPMCGMKWSYSTPFDVFQKHVTDHFPLNDNDFTSLENEFEGMP